jgi:hypothetical protein
MSCDEWIEAEKSIAIGKGSEVAFLEVNFTVPIRQNLEGLTTEAGLDYLS